MSSTTISTIGNFPFCIRETAQDGLPVEIWDGNTYFDTNEFPTVGSPQFFPSKTEEGVLRYPEDPGGGRIAITVVGPGTLFPIGLTLEELMFLYWRVKRWGVKPTDGDIWRNQGPGNGTPLDIYPIIEQGLEIEYTRGFFHNTDEGSLNCARGEWNFGFDYVLEEVFDSAPPNPQYTAPGVAQITFDLRIGFNFGNIADYYDYFYWNNLDDNSITPVFRIGDLYYPPISVEAIFESYDSLYCFTDNVGTDPPIAGYLSIDPAGYFVMNTLPWKFNESDYQYSNGFIIDNPTLKENAFNLVIKLPTRDLTIPFDGIYESYEQICDEDNGVGIVNQNTYLVSSLPMVYTAEPVKYFSYGGTYDEDTGEPVASP